MNTDEMNSLAANTIVFSEKESFESVLKANPPIKVKPTHVDIEPTNPIEYNMAADSHLKWTAPVRNRTVF